MFKTETFELDRANNALVFQRRIPASPERLFDAWTRPEQVRQWWDPSGRELAECEIDLRVGGLLRFVNAGPESFPFEGRFQQIDRPHGFAFDALGAAGSVRFVPDGEVTEMTVVIRCASPEHLQQFVQMGVADGTSRTLDNLASYVGSAQG
ncbi:hypothetical protein Rumeso_01864 [Rubellimicrobium mesophilum DSM 19309]|uniref:Activator of Hsp90 ATPase homologue 1/2-like C-terminal domain-containing protein n=1 Tax=Rubellimicrobium mesophilum DSM 19309 TaxID=442562 RepID=A0A017HS78_9RHOB|nr:SRPBCC domain-containing protein [Rubellimicrobium mesophilum]EYD76584.1 hypothetical protein Rumeso_01864 [Rubellimicrobium mesophilum DSM 19309]